MEHGGDAGSSRAGFHSPTALRGRVAAVRGTIIDFAFDGDPPPIGAALECERVDGSRLASMVHSHRGRGMVRAIAIQSTRGLQRGLPVIYAGKRLEIPVGSTLLGRIVDLRGQPLDGGPAPSFSLTLPLQRPAPLPSERRASGEIYPTGIKVIDLFCPFTYGARVAVFGGAGVGKTVVLTEFIHNAIETDRKSVV